MIPFILAGLGGYLIGNSLKDQQLAKGGLAGFDVSSLDALEKIQYQHLTEKSKLSKEDALSVIINNVEGDYEQLSSKLAKIAKKLAEIPNKQISLFGTGGDIKEAYVWDVYNLRNTNQGFMHFLQNRGNRVGTLKEVAEYIKNKTFGYDLIEIFDWNTRTKVAQITKDGKLITEEFEDVKTL